MSSEHVILLVNNIPDHAVTYGRALTGHGFRVHLVQSGDEALRLVRRMPPACVIIDLRLPDMSGWELCRRLRASETGRRLRVVVLTPELSKTCASNSARVGCDAWLAHPTIAEDLVRTVKRVLSLDTTAPISLDEALLGLVACTACGSEDVRPTLRVSPVQYYCCRSCGFCWRADLVAPVS